MMNSSARLLIVSTLLAGVGCGPNVAIAGDGPPALPREFRAAWVATVANIDWPTVPGLPVQDQQAELIKLLDRAVALNLNAIIFQVRPAADALYASTREPWSPYLTGKMGVAPEPPYDPLEFVIREAHQRCLELHVWFNPYRALHKSFQGETSSDHISNTHPDYVREYDGYLWLDPGHRAAMQHSLDVIADVVQRYDVDGVHLDDYFYPYPIKDEDGNRVPFPDEETWQTAGTSLSRDDWRRENVDRLIEGMYRRVKEIKPWVRVGISPFGIWRPGHPPGIQGFDAYAEIYADAKKWLQAGWLDYATPQLYWPVDSEAQSYPKLLGWWHEQNVKQRHLWPGNYASRVGMSGERNWPAEEIVRQIGVTREQTGASGNVLFSMKSLMPEYGPLGDALANGPYAEPAVVPATPWLNDDAPLQPVVKWSREGTDTITLRLAGKEKVGLWVVQSLRAGSWNLSLYPGTATEIEVQPAERIAVSKLSRTGVQGPLAIIPLGRGEGQ